jgi:hypothetical protein
VLKPSRCGAKILLSVEGVQVRLSAISFGGFRGGIPVKRSLLAFFASSALVLLLSVPLFAHHSMSMYASDRSVSLKATVTHFAWGNPHTQIQFEVQDDQGVAEKWLAECPSPSRLSNAGWNSDTLKPGDQITIIGGAAKDGSHSMRLDRIVLADGRELGGYRRDR